MEGCYLIILGACAMTLGCKIRPLLRQKLSNACANANLWNEAEKQMRGGLNKYKCGVPYKLDSPGLLETVNRLAAAEEKAKEQPEAQSFPVATSGAATAFDAQNAGDNTTKSAENMFANDKCAGCGAKSGEDGSILLT